MNDTDFSSLESFMTPLPLPKYKDIYYTPFAWFCNFKFTMHKPSPMQAEAVETNSKFVGEIGIKLNGFAILQLLFI